MRDYIFEACETIDAAIFSGDAFHDEEHRKELKALMDRWYRELDRIEQSIQEE